MLWRFFPGPWWVRLIVLLVALVALVYVLITFVYPWATEFIPQPESTVDS